MAIEPASLRESPDLAPPLLVTGASGFLGRYVCHLARGRYTVHGLYCHRQPPSIAAVQWHPCDLTDTAHFAPLLDGIRPQAVLHLAAEANTGRCDRDPEGSDRLNRHVPLALAELCGDRSIPFLFTSTGLVFDGNHAPYRESDPVCPLMRYGQQKAAAEAALLALATPVLILRLPLLFGTGEWPASNFMETLDRSLRQGQSVNLFTDEYRTPLSGWTAAQGLVQAVGWGIAGQRGLVHLAGVDRISRYELGLRVAHWRGYDPTLLRPCSRSILGLHTPRPADTSLDITLARSLGYAPPSLDQQLLTCPRPEEGLRGC
ncbi:MAG: SDR family oxidoreductase [Prochlorothrix sp.]